MLIVANGSGVRRPVRWQKVMAAKAAACARHVDGREDRRHVQMVAWTQSRNCPSPERPSRMVQARLISAQMRKSSDVGARFVMSDSGSRDRDASSDGMTPFDRPTPDQSAQHLAAIVESSDDAIVTKNLEGVITSWNRGAERLFGYTAQEAIGRSVTMLIPVDRPDEEPGILARLRRGEKIDHYETIRRRKDGSLIHISMSVSPLRDESGRIFGASKIARDITDRHRAFEQQQLLLKEMEHRIKNVFSIASGLIALCARRAQTPEELSKMARERLDALARAHALTAPRPDGDAEDGAPSITLHELLQTIVAPHLDSTERSRFAVLGNNVELSSKTITPIALALNELITNAVKYGALSSPSGTVTFEVQNRDEFAVLRWTERGGPPISVPPHRSGFGTRLSEITVGQLGGTIRRDWNKDGLSAEIALKRSSFDPMPAE